MLRLPPLRSECAFCELAQGRVGEQSTPDDIVARSPHGTAFISAAWWPANPGHVLIIPNAHRDSLFDLRDAEAADLHALTRRVAMAMLRAYHCEGISTRQHSGVGAGQSMPHYHLHVFPRWAGDRLYERSAEKAFVPVETRAPFAARLRSELNRQGLTGAAAD
ncbi:HIT family protein [Deinococcus soli (ex Cha et al. 2016)]|uniref:Histidine triad (HIT) family protein n=2 Tax=Deinococcus soli (ex Cha et al. 2016) TaxID=1309411 RepID=A0AAE3XEF3_9DEIO|nr:HIT family protein [Deinococcus soli (ex Cha et al. 2016)]MDR6218987.1 histidine triad (HIT) family protein [Deinococcus soli (ex Cha et al. 2016)]MDR6328784.1 histidine triad (HIT) family protein [Deinococcus soli (ex Cha et al. 2016)]MDR6751729.1 histidine triad (HIT) family protein [Deinococcus soli (ex Cha et al. 2016)]